MTWTIMTEDPRKLTAVVARRQAIEKKIVRRFVTSKRLTKLEKKAVGRVLEEFLSGHDAEMVRACGVADSEAEGALILKRLSNAAEKLSQRY